MYVADLAAMTAVKIKEFSTITFTKFTKGFLKIDFFRRNRKTWVICLAIWLAANITGYLIYRSEIGRAYEALYRQGLSAVADLATKSGPSVLEKDALALSVEIRVLENIKCLEFAAIIDHENTILTQTGAEVASRKFEPLKNNIPIKEIDDTIITAANSPHNTRVIGFLRNIKFSNVEIGKVYIALSALDLHRNLNRLRLLYFVGVILATLVIAVILLWFDRRETAKALKLKEDLENMKRIGPYWLQDKVAQGGMAELFLADYVREDGFRRRVAIKRILPHLAANPNFIKMFTREARLAALLQHPNIVQIFDYGKIENAYFIAMEYIDGKNLGDILSALKQGGLAASHAVFIVSEICKGLDYSHNKRDDKTGQRLNIIHRDISPQNILVSYQGEVKIGDFGISKARSEPSLTQAGVIKGKLAYLSPEQALGENVDHRADIYALGLVFYETLTGKRVYSFSSDIEAIQAIPKLEIEPLRDSSLQIPEDLSRIVMKCLKKKKESRYQTASDLYDDLSVFKKKFKLTLDASDLADFMKKNFKQNGRNGKTNRDTPPEARDEL